MSDAELSRRLKITKHAVGKWRKRGRVPAERVLAVERETGISRHDLRPDLYPRDPRRPIPNSRAQARGPFSPMPTLTGWGRWTDADVHAANVRRIIG